jgi:hypothetical protein
MAALLVEVGAATIQPPHAVETAEDRAAGLEATDWGPAQRLRFPLRIAAGEPSFAFAASALRSAPARFSASMR